MKNLTNNWVVIKKDGTTQKFNIEKIFKAVGKSAERVMVELTKEDLNKLENTVISTISTLGINEIPIATMHNIVECSLDEINTKVSKSYRDYRDYKTNFTKVLDKVYKNSQRILYIGDKENSNSDSALVSTKRSLSFNYLNKELYKLFFLTKNELSAIKDGYIYIHDMSARRDTMKICGII